MTPKEKAIELVNKFKFGDVVTEKLQVVNINIYAKLFALIAVDEIIPIVNSYENALSASQQSDYLEYWYEVKQEIEKL